VEETHDSEIDEFYWTRGYKGWILDGGGGGGRVSLYLYSTGRVNRGRRVLREFKLDPDKPFNAVVIRYNKNKGWYFTKVSHFKTRASAKRSAYRQYKTYIGKLEAERKRRASGYIPPKLLCHSCETRKKQKGDYLCQQCRFGDG
jgi:hypothetical protein